MKLNPVNRPKGHNSYCGPAVISAVTGCTTNEAASVIRLLTGRESIKGTYTHEVRNALSKYGVTMKRMRVDRPTLTQWLKANRDKRTLGRVFLIVAGHHWQLISGRRYVCGRTGDIVSVKDHQVKRRARVTEVWELDTEDAIGLCEDIQKRLGRKADERKRDQSDRACLRRLIPQAERLGLIVENDSEPGYIRYWVSPDNSWRDDPREDEHFAYDADMMLELIEYYRAYEDTHRASPLR